MKLLCFKFQKHWKEEKFKISRAFTNKINPSSSTQKKIGAYDYSLDPTQFQGILKVM
jgi:hypothetical protein